MYYQVFRRYSGYLADVCDYFADSDSERDYFSDLEVEVLDGESEDAGEGIVIDSESKDELQS